MPTVISHFDRSQQSWIRPVDPEHPERPGLVIYARVDNGFSVYDPIRNSHVAPHVSPTPDAERDRLFLFDLEEQSRVSVREIPWSKQGDTVNWLVSEVFGLRQARSKEAEAAIEAAEAWMRGEDMSDSPEHLRTSEQIHAALLHLLPGHDPFWPRWIVKTQVGMA